MAIMRILIYGAGVIGSLYAALFAQAGFDTSIYARGKRLETLQTRRLLYAENRQVRKADVSVLSKLEDSDHYDFIFLTVRENQPESVHRHQLGLYLFRQVHQVAALDQLHDDDRLAVPDAGLAALAALHRRVVVVHIVELNLYDLDLRVIRRNLFEHLGAVVEGNAGVANFALRLEHKGRPSADACNRNSF